jgi:hypothetical protein
MSDSSENNLPTPQEVVILNEVKDPRLYFHIFG